MKHRRKRTIYLLVTAQNDLITWIDSEIASNVTLEDMLRICTSLYDNNQSYSYIIEDKLHQYGYIKSLTSNSTTTTNSSNSSNSSNSISLDSPKYKESVNNNNNTEDKYSSNVNCNRNEYEEAPRTPNLNDFAISSTALAAIERMRIYLLL